MAIPYQENKPQRKRPNPIISLLMLAGVGTALYIGGRWIQNGDGVSSHFTPAEAVPTLEGLIPATIAAPEAESVPMADGIVFDHESFIPPVAQEFSESFPSHIEPPEFILTAGDEVMREFFESGKTPDGRNAFGLVYEVYRQVTNMPPPVFSMPEFRQFADDYALLPEDESLYDLRYTDAPLNHAVALYKEELQNRLAGGNLDETERAIINDQLLQIDTYDALFKASKRMYYEMVMGPYGLFNYYDKSVLGGTAALTSQGMWIATTAFFEGSGSEVARLVDRYKSTLNQNVFLRAENDSLQSVHEESLVFNTDDYWYGMQVFLDQLR